MADTITNQSTGTEITKNVIRTSRSSSLAQAVNVALNGIVHVQNFGKVKFRVQVEFVIHESNDNLLYEAWRNADLIKVIDDGRIYSGYITSVALSTDFAQGYHEGVIVLQEEVV